MKKILFILFMSLSITSCSDDDTTIINENNELSLQEVATESANTPVWIPRQEMKSRNGDDMGYGALLNPDSDKLIIFLDGGGACFNELRPLHN